MDESLEFGTMYCGACGFVFGLDDIEDFDDVHCPDCGSGDVGGSDELE